MSLLNGLCTMHTQILLTWSSARGPIPPAEGPKPEGPVDSLLRKLAGQWDKIGTFESPQSTFHCCFHSLRIKMVGGCWALAGRATKYLTLSLVLPHGHCFGVRWQGTLLQRRTALGLLAVAASCVSSPCVGASRPLPVAPLPQCQCQWATLYASGRCDQNFIGDQSRKKCGCASACQ